MKKLFLVMNPYAGKRKGNRALADILTLFSRHGFEVTVHMTAGPGDGATAVQQQGKDMDIIVAMGGDGTLNEVITGLLRSGWDIPLGYIPCGSTNDFANSLHIPTKPMDAAKAIVEGTPVHYDVGRFQDRNFSYVASFGAFTKASYATSQKVKNSLGHLAYLLAGAKELFHMPKEKVAFFTDAGDFEGEYLYGAISNSTSVGGILTLDPRRVDMQDGKFELMLIRATKNPFKLLGVIFSLLRKKYDHPMVTFRAVTHLKVSCRADMPWTLDGEKFDGAGELSVDNLHHAIRLVMPHE